MVGFGTNSKYVEPVILVVFSVLVFVFFFFFTGANGLVLGNDPAVHLETAKYFLSEGALPLTDILWLPPLYHLVLATFISFTGAVDVGQQLILLKAVTALMDWLLVFSVYVLASKFFSRKIGFVAASFLLLCFPLYELNSWGGYTSLLSLSFMALLFVYLALPLKSVGNSLVAFILAFSVVLTHQLATFLLAFILPPFIIAVLARSKGNYPKALIAAVIGGGIAFGLYYLGPMLPYLGDLVSIVFFDLKTMIYQVSSVSSSAFIMYFGFIVFFAIAGVIVAFFKLKKQKSLSLYLLLILAFAIPLFFSQTYLLGFYLPFQWFVYYLLPALVVLAAITFSFMIDLALASYSNNKKGWKRSFLKAISVGLVVALFGVMLLHFQTVSGKLQEDAVFYSTSDMSAYQAGMWLRQNNADYSKSVVVSKNPGHWLWVYSGLNTIAETDPVVEWNVNATCVLDMSYEMQHPLTMFRYYEAKTAISDENYVSLNGVWRGAISSREDLSFLSYRDQNGTLYAFPLDSLSKSVTMDEIDFPHNLFVVYSGEDFTLTEKILVQNDSYPLTFTWQLTAKDDLYYPTLFLVEYTDLSLNFTQANVQGILDWESPLSNPTKQSVNEWAATNFYSQNLTTNSRIDIYDNQNGLAYAINFLDLPKTGNVGALWNGQIDALRWEYSWPRLDSSYTYTFSYQTLAFSMSSFPLLKNPKDMNSLFTFKTSEPFSVDCRNFASIIRDNFIGYIVYDINRFDKKNLLSGWMQLVYSNDHYLVLKIKSIHPYPHILESTD